MQSRVDKVHARVELKQRRFCPGVDMPADLPSRGVKASVLSSDAKL